MRKFLFVIVSGIILSSCIKSADYNRKSLICEKVVEEFNDSMFVPPTVKCMDYKNGKLYISDYREGMIVLDENLNIFQTYANHGPGPGETVGAAHFFVEENDSVYLLNEGKNSVELYVEGKNFQTISFPEKIPLTYSTRFFVENNNIFHTTIVKEGPVVVFGKNEEEVRFLGKYMTLPRHLTRHTVKGDDCYFVIGSVLPALQKYSFDGNLLDEVDLSIIPEIERMVKKYKRTAQDPSSYFSIVQDACFYGGKLYMLIATDIDGFYCNLICSIDFIYDKGIKTDFYVLPNTVYTSFCVGDKNVLYAFNPKDSSIEVFKMD